MDKLAASFTTQIIEEQQTIPPGHLLLNGADEIIYANKQARHFLGLLAEEALPAGQKFLPLVRASYQCYPPVAWRDWPKRPSATAARYLIFSSPYRASFSLLKVQIVEQIVVDGQEVCIVTMNLVKSAPETAVARSVIC